MEFSPSEMAIRWLESIGISEIDLAAYTLNPTDEQLSKLVDQLLTKKGRLRALISRIFNRQPKMRVELRRNVERTIWRMEKRRTSNKRYMATYKNRGNGYEVRKGANGKDTINSKYYGMAADDPEFKAAVAKAVRQTLIGTVSRGMARWCYANIPTADQKKIFIRWGSSHALHHDIDHARHYGDTMSLYAAFRKGGLGEGWGVRWGCKCGGKVTSGKEILIKHLKRSPYRSMIRDTK